MNDLVRAALLPFGAVSALRALPLSAGGSNRVFLARAGARSVAVKLRVDRNDDAAREAWALGVAPAAVRPKLLLHTTPRRLVAQACAAGAFSRAARLDAPAGGLLVLERVAGSSPHGPLDVDCARRIARSLRQLHAVRAAGPPVHVGKTPGSAARLAADMLERLLAWRALDRPTGRELTRMLRTSAEEATRAPRPTARLCHGDLRLHNLHDDGRSVRWLDFEHAGIGDPIADLLLFAVRTPLTRHDEQLMWEALLDPDVDASRPRTRADLEAYFRQRPLFGLVSALAAVHDVCAVSAGERPVARSVRAHVDERLHGAREEIAEALGRKVRVRPPAVRILPAAPRRWRGAIIAVDGTASSGKSVVAAGLAERLGLRHVNTGLVYRAAAFLALERGLSPNADGARALAALLARVRIEPIDRDSAHVGDRVLDEALATLEVERVVARFAEHATVRAALAPHIAKATRGVGLVIEGRAIAAATPRARVALFVDADLDVRADRLCGRLGRGLAHRAACSMLRARDRRDATRAIEPNVVAARAVVVDTTRGAPDDSVARALYALRRRRGT